MLRIPVTARRLADWGRHNQNIPNVQVSKPNYVHLTKFPSFFFDLGYSMLNGVTQGWHRVQREMRLLQGYASDIGIAFSSGKSAGTFAFDILIYKSRAHSTRHLPCLVDARVASPYPIDMTTGNMHNRKYWGIKLSRHRQPLRAIILWPHLSMASYGVPLVLYNGAVDTPVAIRTVFTQRHRPALTYPHPPYICIYHG